MSGKGLTFACCFINVFFKGDEKKNMFFHKLRLDLSPLTNAIHYLQDVGLCGQVYCTLYMILHHKKDGSKKATVKEKNLCKLCKKSYTKHAQFGKETSVDKASFGLLAFSLGLHQSYAHIPHQTKEINCLYLII